MSISLHSCRASIYRALLGALVAITVGACSGQQAEVPLSIPIHVDELLASPSRYDGVVVTVTGVAVVEFENTALYSSVVAAENGSAKDGVWIEVDPRSNKSLDRERVGVMGRFRSGDAGHFGLFAGEISPVHSIWVVEKGEEDVEEDSQGTGA